jgi:adenosine deaminase
MDLRELPKIDLHCHLDCSVRVATVRDIGNELGLSLPEKIEDALVAPPVCDNLMDYLRRVDLALEVMQREQDLRRIARELVEDFKDDGVIYGEVRFAPQFHTRRGLSLQQVVNAVHTGLEEGTNRYRVLTSLVLCCIRQQDPTISFEIAQLAADNRDKVCAIDLAGDESGFAGTPHAAAFVLAERARVHRTVHAGEAGGSDRIREAIDVLHAERIGHGVGIVENPDLISMVKARKIALELCPHSNVRTRAVESFGSHPIDYLLKEGLAVTVNTDG